MNPKGIAAKVAIYLIRFYQKCISPLLPAVCRFEPTCSEYGRQAFATHGFFRGLYLTTRRLLKCHPFYKGCDHDPVPPSISDKKH